MSHAINSHVLIDKNPCINLAIHVLLMHGFCTLHIHILGCPKNWRHQSWSYAWKWTYLMMLGWRMSLICDRCFKTYEYFMLLRAIIVIQKWTFRSVFPKFSSEKMTLCINNDQTWFSDTLTSARPLGGVKTLTFQSRVSTPPSVSSRWKCIEKHVWSLYLSYHLSLRSLLCLFLSGRFTQVLLYVIRNRLTYWTMIWFPQYIFGK